MRDLNPDTVLQCATDLSVTIHSGTSIRAFLEGEQIDCGPHALAIFNAFLHPTPLSQALKRLEGRIIGAQDWVEMTSTIIRFVEAGILRDEKQARVRLGVNPLTFDAAPEQVAMLNDRVRTTGFMEAICEIVRPGDVVVEIGTGTGILAITAARAGARHVYAIEAGAIGKTARTMFEANRLADRITLLERWSSEVTLPERADILVSEIIGNDPLAEGVLEFTADAVRRLLKPDGRLVPARLQLFGLPVTIPRERLLKRTFAAETVSSWQTWYDIDFSPLFEAARKSPHYFFMWPQLARDWPKLSEPIPLADLDLRDDEQFRISSSQKFTATCSGRLNGLIVYFVLGLSPAIRLSTHPTEADKDNCWSSPVWLFPDALEVTEGEILEVTYSYRVPGSRNAVRITKAGQSPAR